MKKENIGYFSLMVILSILISLLYFRLKNPGEYDTEIKNFYHKFEYYDKCIYLQDGENRKLRKDIRVIEDNIEKLKSSTYIIMVTPTSILFPTPLIDWKFTWLSEKEAAEYNESVRRYLLSKLQATLTPTPTPVLRIGNFVFQ